MRAHTVTSMTRPRRYAWRRAPLLIVLSVFALAISATASVAQASASADTVRDWNRYATAAVANAPTAPVMPGVGQPAHLIQVHLAIVQGAVYDAVNAIDGGYQPYLVAPAADPSDSKDAAAATAAHEVLIGLKGLGGAPMLPPAVRALARPALYAVAGGGPGRAGQDGGNRDRRGRRLGDARRAGRRRTLRHVPVHGGLRSLASGGSGRRRDPRGSSPGTRRPGSET